MAVVKLNGVKVDLDREYLKDMKNGQLNQMLGENGMPKYSANQMKSKNKASLLEEVNAIVAEMLAAKDSEESAPKERKPAGSKLRASKNLNVARSKKCRTLEKLADGRMSLHDAKIARDGDPLFAQICSIEELERAANEKIRPRQAVQTRVLVTLDDESIPLKPNERLNRRGDIIADANPSWSSANDDDNNA